MPESPQTPPLDRPWLVAAWPGMGHVAFNAGVYLLAASVLDGVEPGTMVSLEQDVLPRMAGTGAYAWISPGPFIDIGTEESFHQAQQLMAEWPGGVGE